VRPIVIKVIRTELLANERVALMFVARDREGASLTLEWTVLRYAPTTSPESCPAKSGNLPRVYECAGSLLVDAINGCYGLGRRRGRGRAIRRVVEASGSSVRRLAQTEDRQCLTR